MVRPFNVLFAIFGGPVSYDLFGPKRLLQKVEPFKASFFDLKNHGSKVYTHRPFNVLIVLQFLIILA